MRVPRARPIRSAMVNETIGVAVLMGGCPAAIYGTEALRAYEEFTASA
jgi:hypothetical protein